MAQLKVGDQAPDFETKDEQGNPVKLSDLRGKRVVLYFYPKDDTPGCTRHACGFRDSYSNIEGQNSVVLGISPDDTDSHQAFKSKHSLPFPLLVDPDHSIVETYNVWGEREVNGNKFMGIIRSSFVIDEQGKVIDARYNVSPEDSVESALQALG